MKTEHGLLIGKVWHQRFRPVGHAFQYPFWWLWVNLDDIDGLLTKSPWWGRSWRPVVFREDDYLDGLATNGASQSLRTRVVDKALQQGMDWRTGIVCAMTQPRLFGFLFNPLSLYWHFPEGSDEPDAVIAEVQNTPWRERHCYGLKLTNSGNKDEVRHAKAFHVSPFMPIEQDYQWQLDLAQKDVRVVIENWDAEGRIFAAGVTMQKHRADAASMFGVIREYGLQGVKVSAAIYAQAWKLWRKGRRKGLAFHVHPDRKRASEQKL
ncbi:MAG: DUF1365 domain-containing protein [Alcanivoracaceae bacterium]|nr:DUF1365 domain-containing protein [Alcanivoracaceae bacterium]